MRISRRTRKEEPKKIFYSNETIPFPKVFVIDAGGQSHGVMSTTQAVALAREQDLDLVIINPKADPPVAKVLDYGQFRYQQEKEARIAKAHQHVVDIKGVRLSLRIGQHDLDIRKQQSIKFLNGGDKVKIEIILRGREQQQARLAFDLIRDFINEVNAVVPVRIEQPAEKHGNKVTALIVKT